MIIMSLMNFKLVLPKISNSIKTLIIQQFPIPNRHKEEEASTQAKGQTSHGENKISFVF